MLGKRCIISEFNLSRDFTISTRYFNGANKIHEIYVDGSYIYQNGDHYLIYKGELVHPSSTLKFILNNNIEKEGFKFLKELKGDFVIAYYNAQKNYIQIFNDKLGLEPLYYYIKKGDNPELILSTDFWRMIDLVDPTEEDFNVQAIKEIILFLKPLFWRTIIKGVYFFPAATLGKFNIRTFNYESVEYWDFKFSPDNDISLDEAVEDLDHAINTAVREIVNLNGVSKVYGVGISGGLDTRIIPSYLFQNGVEQVVSFIIGKRKPHKIFLSRDHKNAQEIAKYYGIDHHECDYDLESFEDKIALDVRAHPLRSSNILKVLTKTIPNFDVLITGGYGTIVGGHLLFKGMNALTTDEEVDTIAATLSRINARDVGDKSILSKFFKKMRVLIFNELSTGRKTLRRREIKGIISEDEFRVALTKIKDYVVHEKNKGKSNYDIFMKYHLLLSSKYGAFEGLSGTRKNYSIYFPYTLEEVSNWKPEYVIGRKVFEYLIYKKLPELTKIPGQNSELPIYCKYEESNILIKKYRQIMSFLIFFIRGNGLNYDQWIRTRKFQKFSLDILRKNNVFFNNIFQVNEIIDNMDSMNELVYENIIKIKYILDLILSKKYKLWFTESNDKYL